MIGSFAGRPRSWVSSPVAGIGLPVLTAAVLGLAVAAVDPLVIGAGLVGALVLGAVLRWPPLGLFVFLLVVAFLPFGVIPVRVGVQLTFVDAALIATYAAFVPRLLALARQRGGLAFGATGGWVLGFATVAVAAYVVGTGSVPVPAEGSRRFAKLLASLLFFVVALNLLVPSRTVLFTVARGLMLTGAVAGGLASLLWLLPHPTQLALLLRLVPWGYPSGNVLRYEPAPGGTYTDQLRAVGTAVDPNVLGGTVMLAAAVILVQLFATRAPLMPRPVLALLAVPALAGVLLSFSRASWVGLAAGVLFVGRRDRRVWLAAIVGAVVLLALPIGQRALDRFVGGFSAADPATALRLGEYRNAMTLIQRYPVLGIGFGSSPDIDVTAGVSSVYLLVGEQTGLLGLALFGWALLSTLLAGPRASRGARRAGDGPLEGLATAATAAFSGALVAGLADHYFANQAFPHAVALFWLYAAVVVACERQAGAQRPVVPRGTIRAGSSTGSTRLPLAAVSARRTAASPSFGPGCVTLERLGRR